MKRIASLLLAALIAVTCLSGCGLGSASVPDDVVDDIVNEYLATGPFAGKQVESGYSSIQTGHAGLGGGCQVQINLNVRDGSMNYLCEYSGSFSRSLLAGKWTCDDGSWDAPQKVSLEIRDDPGLWISAAAGTDVPGNVDYGSSSECEEVIYYLAEECIGDYSYGYLIQNDDYPALQIYIIHMTDDDAASRLFFSMRRSLIDNNGAEYFGEAHSELNYDYMEGDIYDEAMSMLRCGDVLLIVDMYGDEHDLRGTVYSILRAMEIEPGMLK